MITTVIEDFPHFCGLMALVGHAALIAASPLSAVPEIHEISIALMRPGVRFKARTERTQFFRMCYPRSAMFPESCVCLDH